MNEAMTQTELSRLRVSEERGRPYGEDRWVGRLVSELGLEYTIRDPWRPAKAEDKWRKNLRPPLDIRLISSICVPVSFPAGVETAADS